MAVLRRLDAAAVRRWCAAALVDLRARRQEIDDLNVYPVPDGDAGTNMLATMESVDEALRQAQGDDLAGTMKALARGALVGARGNSGVILSQVLSGFADVLGPLRSAGGEKLKDALDAAVSKAYAAVSQPAEGTILTVARGAARAARAVEGDDFAAVISAAAAGARQALEGTTEQLPALKAAGVVDAGGRGLVVVLEALARVMGAGTDAAAQPPPLVARDPAALVGARESGSPEFGYEVQFLLDAEEAAIAPLKQTLGALGDSLVLVGGDGLYNVHVHVNDVGAAIEAAVTAGRPHSILVTRFADQIAQQQHAAARPVLAGAAGPGLHRLFAAAGAVVVPAGCRQDELAAIVDGTGADDLVLLPNCRELHAVGNRLAASRASVHVVPTRSPVQGLAALAVHDASRPLADDVIAMTAAAAAARVARVVRPEHGDYAAVVDDAVVASAETLADATVGVLAQMVSASDEIVTLIAGEAVDRAALDVLTDRVRAEFPRVEVETHRGDQVDDVLLIGVE